MSDRDLRRLDIGLLLVFDAAMRLKNLTAAARELGFTQSAVSHGLARLRSIFGDELLLRQPHGMEPTARALALHPDVITILDLARAAVTGGSRFHAASASATVRIAALDYHCSLFAAGLIETFNQEAPGLRLSFRPLARDVALAALAAAEVDLAIGFFPQLDGRFGQDLIAEQGYALIARREHPSLGRLAGLEGYCAARHLLVSFNGDAHGVVDEALARLGRTRDVVATVPYYHPALASVADSDLVATVPRLLAERYAGRYGLKVLEPPLAVRSFRVVAVRHRRDAANGLIDWLVGRLLLLASHPAGPVAPT